MSLLLMSRIVVVVLALFVLWRLLSAVGKRASSRGLGADSYSRFSPEQRRRRTGQRPRGPEELLQCSSCGTFVPRGRALPAADGDIFCSPECRDAASDGVRREQ
jgi:hypothetical protein